MGGYGRTKPPKGIPSIEELLRQYAGGVSLSSGKIVLVQVILYSESMKAPSAQDVQKWAQHFKLNRSKNCVVLAGTPELVNSESYKMIPGFQLVDRDFILRADSTGHKPRHNLYTELLPLIPKLLREDPS